MHSQWHWQCEVLLAGPRQGCGGQALGQAAGLAGPTAPCILVAKGIEEAPVAAAGVGMRVAGTCAAAWAWECQAWGHASATWPQPD